LVEQHNTINIRVKITPVMGFAAGPGTAMQEHHRDAPGITALLYIEAVQVIYLQSKMVIGLDFRV
jgi:hypothetical protein